MGQYINKDKAIAEIEKAVDEPAPSHDQQCPWEDGYYCGLYKAEGIIENLEVKEADFGTEVYKYIDEHFNVYDDGNQTLQTKDKKSLIGRIDVENIAKHFFELGMTVSNKV